MIAATLYECPKCKGAFDQQRYNLHVKSCLGRIQPSTTQYSNINYTIPNGTTYLNNYNISPNVFISPQTHVQPQERTQAYRPRTAIYYNNNQQYNLPRAQTYPHRNENKKMIKCNVCKKTIPESDKKDHLLCHKMEQEDKDRLQAQRLQDEDLFNNASPEEVEQQRRIEEYIRRQGQNNNNNNFIMDDFNFGGDSSMGMGMMNPMGMGIGNMRGMNGIPNVIIRRGGNMNNMNDFGNLNSGMGSPDFFRNFFNGMNGFNGFNGGNGMRRIIIPMGGMGGMGGQNDLNEIIERMLHHTRDNPTDAAIVSELPETKIDDINKLDNDKKNCVICMEDFKAGDTSTNLPCLHMFHTNCIQSWLKKQNTCPICKFKLTPENINNINSRGQS